MGVIRLTVTSVITLCGGIGLFLYGMKLFELLFGTNRRRGFGKNTGKADQQSAEGGCAGCNCYSGHPKLCGYGHYGGGVRQWPGL